MLDNHTLFSNAQAITATAASTNVYDTGATPDSGAGQPIVLFCGVGTAFSVLTHLEIKAQTSATENFTSTTNLFSTSASLTQLGAGSIIHLPAITGGCLRYLRLHYTVAGSNATSGTITAGIVLDKHNNVAAPDAL